MKTPLASSRLRFTLSCLYLAVFKSRARFKLLLLFAFAPPYPVLSAASSVYEGFAYPENVPLDGQNGGVGFSGAWSGSPGYRILPGSFNVAGAPVSGNFLHAGGATITRQLSEPIGVSGTTRYLSVATRFV